jgi:6-phosphogluconolactonase/glucosamine-6-phosphate isomerase/deaminase
VLHTVGASKREALEHVLSGPSRTYPASLLRRERLTVVVDHAARPAP